ncbi:copper chaperone for superoxide dismutase-like [Uloborus diversus]|uniref:copper chaperone for superoxide dismutase-like n=1 Tax=Uloborus diversus TaxID=327109 RepID=UPI00240997DB|nr:copper chaperone for superoxide dismutase-like [Uloborus diversus]XP_054712779.1 copper chaperone for superoxide dismutase-like [Uloborus diversus]XP_054712780.1 copper chaperone for superoxide dismutase-like [Uloborus diversus]XP_054712782.1 copper chaperone for superoxide dismutase-like [Uloborus diversus]XP_054712783.1 copper chaperone for superoxide dismutase-like [Uloborus diversus]
MTSGRSETSMIEFDVNLTCNNCALKVENVLTKLKGVDSFSIDVEKQSVVVETAVPSQIIKEAIQSTGKIAVLKGLGASKLGSAVAEFRSQNILGVIRFHQLNQDVCIIDGTVDGLSPREYEINIHEFGDLSDEYNNIGSVFNPVKGQQNEIPEKNKRHYGNLKKIEANSDGRASFHFEDPVIKVWDIIGRSIVISSEDSKLVCAVIARSSGLFENPKRLCQCDGVSIWDERKK